MEARDALAAAGDAVSSRSLKDASPVLAERFLRLQTLYQRRFAPWSLIVVSVYRTPQEQLALFSQGRETLDVVNDRRVHANLPPIGPTENARVVTWTTRSRHTRYPAEAIDVAVALDPDGPDGPLKPRIDWEDTGHYRPLIALGDIVGLISGAAWSTPDWGHLELPHRPTIEEV